jgi:hypothetical protein
LEGALGYDILHPSSIKNDLFFQSKLTNTTIDTVNTLIDFEIVNITKTDSESQITLAPYLPITLGRKFKNYGNNSSYTLTEIATIQNTNISGDTVNGISSAAIEVSTDAIKNMDYGDAVFIGGDSSTAVFVGYIREFLFIKGQPQYGPVLLLDRDVSPTTGHKVYSVSKDTHDLFFVNGEHLWGGKILTIPHPRITSSGSVPLNLENIYNTDGLSNSTCDTNHTSGLSDGSTTSVRHITMDSTTNIKVGMRVRGTGIPDNTVVSAINNSTCITISANPTATNTNITLSFGETSIAKKYGQYYYKTLSMSNGEFNLLNTKSTAVEDSKTNMYENSSKLAFHSIAYKFSPNAASDNLNEFDKTGTNANIQMDYDMRGYGSPYGSLFSGRNLRLQRSLTQTKYPSTFNILGDGTDSSEIESLRSSIEQIDTSAATLFFYVNSDILPYSSLRQDSLMDGNKDIQKYNMFLLENNKNIDGELEYTETTSGKRKLLTDKSFQKISFDSEQDISSLKRFGIMRLTELCFDAHFNIINPEKPTISDKKYIRLSDFDAYHFESTANTIHVANSASAGNNSIVLDVVGGSNPANGEVLYDSEFRLLGTVHSYNASTKTVTFAYNTRLNYDNSYTSGLIYKREIKVNVKLNGAKDADSFITHDRAHLQKGALISENYASHANDFWAQNTNNNSRVLNRSSNEKIAYPIRFNYDRADDLRFRAPNGPVAPYSAQSLFQLPSRPFGYFYETPENVFSNCKAVILDTYNIEQGGLVDIEKGLAIPTSGFQIRHFDSGVDVTDIFMLQNDITTFGRQMPASSANTGLAASGSAQYEASGAKLCFTPRLSYVASEHDSSVAIGSSNGNLFSTGFVASSIAGNFWLDFVDITGCYLVAESGYDTDLKTVHPTGTSRTTTTTNTGVTEGGAMSRMDNRMPDSIIYVVSHEINNAGSVRHTLTTDFQLTDGKSYRVMKPNETAFYDKSPKKINLNTLSAEYTKKANSDEMYSPKQEFSVKRGSRLKSTTMDSFGPINEAILSMYVAVDLDKQSSDETCIVLRKAKHFLSILPDGNHSLYMSDGKNSQLTSIHVYDTAIFQSGIEKQVQLKFGDIKEMNGIVSVSEPFTVSSFNKIDIDPTRACIGTTVSIGLEGEDLINELLEREGISFEIPTNTSSPIFMSPNFQGVDLYSALRFVSERKNMRIIEENNVFKAIVDDSSSIHTNITIDDSDKYLISDFEKVQTLFDFYNEIIVYGQSHKAVRKDIRSIQKRGRKTLEVVDNSLITQGEVNEKALKLLRLHSKFNTKLTFTMQNKGINQLRVGDLVNVSIPRENIKMSEFIILEMEHQLTGFIKLQLGRFSKDLSDIFSELLVSSKETKSALRTDNLSFNEVSFNFSDNIDTKELKLLVRKREASGASRTLGFITSFGFSTNSELGFTGGEITITDLVEEELA